MSRRVFDRYMVQIGMGTHPKFARLTDGEFRAHIVGVLAIAAMAPVRGYLLVGELSAEAVDVAAIAGVSTRTAASAMNKLKDIGVLIHDEALGCLRVHDWDDINPSPKADSSAADRQRRRREKLRHADVTPLSRRDNRDSHADVTPPEVEVEVEPPTSATPQQVGARKRATRRVDQSEIPSDLPAELAAKVEEILGVLHGIWEARGGIEPQARGVGLALKRNPRADHMRVARRLEHWLLAGNGQGKPCRDVTSRYAEWVAEEVSSKPLSVVEGAKSEREERRAAGARALDELMSERSVGA